MKIKNIIDKVNRLKPNNIDTPDMIDWLSEVDGRVYNEILSRAADYTGTFTPYQAGEDDNDLLVPFPYDTMYLDYLSAKVDFQNGEIVSHNNNMSNFNTTFDDFAAYYRRNHIPK